MLYYSQGRYGEAEPLYQEALAMRKRLLGDEHPDVATSLNNLALLYNNQGRYGEAEPLYQEALAMWKRLLGDGHPDVASSLNNLGCLYWEQGRYGEADLLYQEAPGDAETACWETSIPMLPLALIIWRIFIVTRGAIRMQSHI